MTPDDPLEGMGTKPCSFCGGSGTTRKTKTLHYVSIEDGEESEPVAQRAIIGEPCPGCIGRGRVGFVGQKLNS